MGYRWFDRVTNWRFLHETGSRPVACTIRQSQLRLYEHVECFPKVDLAYRTLFERQPGVEETKGMSTELMSWDVLWMGRAPACRLARRNPKEWRRMVGGATRNPKYSPID